MGLSLVKQTYSLMFVTCKYAATEHPAAFHSLETCYESGGRFSSTLRVCGCVCVCSFVLDGKGKMIR